MNKQYHVLIVPCQNHHSNHIPDPVNIGLRTVSFPTEQYEAESSDVNAIAFLMKTGKSFPALDSPKNSS